MKNKYATFLASGTLSALLVIGIYAVPKVMEGLIGSWTVLLSYIIAFGFSITIFNSIEKYVLSEDSK